MEETKEVKKLSYEELENACKELMEQNRQLYAELNKQNLTNLFTRLDYLFKIVKYKDSFEEAFVKSTVDEIVTCFTKPEVTEEK